MWLYLGAGQISKGAGRQKPLVRFCVVHLPQGFRER